MRKDETILYEQFAAARLKAVELTDAYRETASDDPRRAVLWEGVMRQTELARGLLESWLATSTSVDAPTAASANEVSAVR